MGFSKRSIDDVDRHELDDIEPDVLPIGLELRPSAMRPSVWHYEAGESSNRHYQAEQEELYVPLSGEFEVEIAEQDETDESDAEPGESDPETVEIGPDAYLVVDPETIRQVTATTEGRLLVIGAPNVKDDGVVVD